MAPSHSTVSDRKTGPSSCCFGLAAFLKSSISTDGDEDGDAKLKCSSTATPTHLSPHSPCQVHVPLHSGFCTFALQQPLKKAKPKSEQRKTAWVESKPGQLKPG